jgi:sortase A
VSESTAPLSRRQMRAAQTERVVSPAEAAPPVADRPSRTPVAEPLKAPKPKKPRRRLSVIGVFGELLLTAGALVLLYVGWQLYIGDLIYGAQASTESQALSEQWDQEAAAAAPSAEPAPEEAPVDEAPAAPITADPPVLPQPADAETFAVMHIPRFGGDWAYQIAGGTTRSRTLDTTRIGHYTDAAMPGELGNFAVAAHRTTYGAPFNRIADIRVGDAIVVEVPEGWYVYRFRTLEYVQPTAVEVLADVPQQPDLPADGRYITMTSCSPMFSLAERIVGYGVFDSFTPRDAGPPPALTEVPA